MTSLDRLIEHRQTLMLKYDDQYSGRDYDNAWRTLQTIFKVSDKITQLRLKEHKSKQLGVVHQV